MICQGCDAEIILMTDDTKPFVVCGSCAVQARIASARESVAAAKLAREDAQKRYVELLSLPPNELGEVLMHAIGDYNLRPAPVVHDWLITVAMVAATALAREWKKTDA